MLVRYAKQASKTPPHRPCGEAAGLSAPPTEVDAAAGLGAGRGIRIWQPLRAEPPERRPGSRDEGRAVSIEAASRGALPRKSRLSLSACRPVSKASERCDGVVAEMRRPGSTYTASRPP